MWKLLGTILFVLIAGRLFAAVPSPTSHTRLAAQHLAAQPVSEQPYLRYISLLAVPEKQLDSFRRVFSWWVNNLSFEPAVSIPRDVEGSDGRLLVVDLRDYRWNAAAWQAVGERDYLFQEPWIPHADAERLRKAMGITLSDEAVKNGRFPVVGIVWGPQLFRDTIETDRVPSYYDLLFAQQRFGGEEATTETRTETRIIDHPGGDFAYPDDSGRVNKNVKSGRYEVELRFQKRGAKRAKFVDFPKDEDDWNKAFGIDKTAQFTKETRINLDFGAVVEGGRDNPKAGSIVALQNRLLVFTPTVLGLATKTFDVKETSGERDFAQQLIFQDGKFRRGDSVKAVSDAGELLAPLPNGGQAGFLINGEGKRIEVADARFANDTSDKRLNIGVRTPGSCVACHAPANGINMPRNLVEDMLKDGVDIRFSDRDQYNRFKSFFRGWEKRTKATTETYADLIAATTKGPNPKEVPWTGARVSKEFAEARDLYDNMVSPAVAAAEFGVTLAEFKAICLKSPRARLSELGRGRSIPRRTWESGVAKEAGLLLSLEGKK